MVRPKGSPAELERRRLHAIELIEQGVPPHVVAERLGVDPRSVGRWKRAYRQQGRAGVKARPASGRPSKLALRQRRTLVRWNLRGPDAFGSRAAFWTWGWIQNCLRIVYRDHVGRLLRACRLISRRLQLTAQGRDDRGIRLWLRREWTRLKNNSPGSKPT